MRLRLSCLFIGLVVLSSCGPFSGVGSYTYPYEPSGIPFDDQGNRNGGGEDGGGDA